MHVVGMGSAGGQRFVEIPIWLQVAHTKCIPLHTNKVSTSSSSFSVSRSAIRKALRSLDVEFWLNIPAWITYRKGTNLLISFSVQDSFQWVHYWPFRQHWAYIWLQQGFSLPHCSLSWASTPELHSFGRYDVHDPGLGDPNITNHSESYKLAIQQYKTWTLRNAHKQCQQHSRVEHNPGTNQTSTTLGAEAFRVGFPVSEGGGHPATWARKNLWYPV